MTNSINIVINGEPVPQPRPRFARRGKHVTAYDPINSKGYKVLVRVSVRNQYHDEPLTGPLHVELDVYRPIQKSLSKKERAKRLSGAHRPVVKGDIDNYFKAVTDACTGSCG
ncbi:RusA family crossover junction endodeoxyribonuclease [Secundilactobacillus oryzae]|uniref:RusA family crossover junction endodeoxyribonuclease n=1 Tax=Secundilactobacillus oryzae TaxID=1202668 RepID=UPI000ABDC52F